MEQVYGKQIITNHFRSEFLLEDRGLDYPLEHYVEDNELRIIQGSKQDKNLKWNFKESPRALVQHRIYIDQPSKRDIINTQKACSGRHKNIEVIKGTLEAQKNRAGKDRKPFKELWYKYRMASGFKSTSGLQNVRFTICPAQSL